VLLHRWWSERPDPSEFYGEVAATTGRQERARWPEATR